MTDAANVRIGSIVIHSHEFDRMVGFWCKALGYVPRTIRGGLRRLLISSFLRIRMATFSALCRKTVAHEC